jgi:hypothetical protein
MGCDTIAFTIVAHNYIPRARIVADSFTALHPDSPFYIVVTDYPLQVSNRRQHDPRLIPLTDIDFGAEGFELMAAMYDITEFATAVKPFALRHFLAAAECVLYLDPDIEVFGSLAPLIEATRSGRISLTPHCLQPMRRDGCQPAESDIMSAGVYNLGYIGVARGAEEFVDWWAQRLRRDAISDPARQLFTDQRWIDLSIPLFHPYVEHSPAYNVAYWNLDQRDVRRVDGNYVVNGEPLRFFHYSGYDPKSPHWVSKHLPTKPRVVLSDNPDLAALFDRYAQQLLALSEDESSAPYGWSQAIPGFSLTRQIRRLFRDEVLLADAGLGDMPPTPFLPGGSRDFLRWLAAPPSGTQPAATPSRVATVPRFLNDIWSQRPDLQLAMPEVLAGDLRKLREWVRDTGPAEYELLAELGWLPDLVPPAEPGWSWHEAGPGEHGVNLVGDFNADEGVGELTRRTLAALRSGGVEVSTVVPRRAMCRKDYPFAVDDTARYDTVVVAATAEVLNAVHQDLGRSFVEGRYVIGQWYWELEEFPGSLWSAFDHVNEVWAASQFMRDAIARSAPPEVTVTHMPIPFTDPVVDPSCTRATMGLPEGFMFLCSWDMHSVFQRSNPEAVISAYRAAFGPQDGACLVLTTSHGRSNLKGIERLRWMSRDRPDIVVIDQALDRVQSATLTGLCDAFVSLHRSEGLGLTIADAMLLEKPVIATGYSGNMDFTLPGLAHLVRWEPAIVPEDAWPYPAGSAWAEPDVAHAAELMRLVVAEPDAARRMAVAARTRILSDHSLEHCGAAMRRRLEQIWSR